MANNNSEGDVKVIYDPAVSTNDRQIPRVLLPREVPIGAGRGGFGGGLCQLCIHLFFNALLQMLHIKSLIS